MSADDKANAVLIEADGRLVVGAGAQRRLQQHAGQFRVVPTTGELVILQRVSHEQVNRDGSVASSLIPPGRVMLAGEIDAVGGMVDVINFIQSNSWSGQLSLVDGTMRKTLFFRRGDIRTASSNVSEDRLGAILYRYGVISEETLTTALKTAGGTRLGHVLVKMGALTPHDVYTYVRKQVEEIFFSVLVLRTGTFYFYRTSDDVGPTSQLQMSTKTLLFDGVRRIDELSYFHEKLPTPQVVLIRREPQPQERLGAKEERVLTLIDGARSLATISRQTHLGEFETTKILYQLLQGGYVQVQSSAPALEAIHKGDSLEDVHTRIVDTYNYAYAKIHAAVSAKGKKQALIGGLESFFASGNQFAPLFAGLRIGDDGALPKQTVLANLKAAAAENPIDYLHRGLNELLFFELFTAGEAVDKRESIELNEKLNEILQNLVGAAPAAPAVGDEDADEPEITVDREGDAV